MEFCVTTQLIKTVLTRVLIQQSLRNISFLTGWTTEGNVKIIHSKEKHFNDSVVAVDLKWWTPIISWFKCKNEFAFQYRSQFTPSERSSHTLLPPSKIQNVIKGHAVMVYKRGICGNKGLKPSNKLLSNTRHRSHDLIRSFYFPVMAHFSLIIIWQSSPLLFSHSEQKAAHRPALWIPGHLPTAGSCGKFGWPGWWRSPRRLGSAATQWRGAGGQPGAGGQRYWRRSSHRSCTGSDWMKNKTRKEGLKERV